MRLRGVEDEETRIADLEQLPELIQHIQSFLSEKEACCSSVLSKSWQHAWHTTGILRFHESMYGQDDFVKFVDETLSRYGRENLGIEAFDLEVGVEEINHRVLASFVQKWVHQVATKRHLKHFLLRVFTEISDTEFKLSSDLIFSSKMLEMVRVIIGNYGTFSISHPVINCQYSLRVLELRNVHIDGGADVINNLISSCCLLEKVLLEKCKGFKKLKVENHGFLSEFYIASHEQDIIVEINLVPSLWIFCYVYVGDINKPRPFNIDALRNLKCLELGGLIMDDAFFNLLKSEFPFLEWLSIVMLDSGLKSIDITCVNSLKMLWLSDCDHTLTHVKVDAPRKPLCCFRYDGPIIPALTFSSYAPQKIEFLFHHERPRPLNNSFFVKLRRLALKSRKLVDIKIKASEFDSWSVNNINVDELTRLVSFPCANVQHLAIKITTSVDNGCANYSTFFKAFFTICHPKYVLIFGDDNLFKFMVKVLMENKIPCLKYVHAEIECDSPKKSPHWSRRVELFKTQTSYWKNFIDGSEIIDGWSYLKFTLTWSS